MLFRSGAEIFGQAEKTHYFDATGDLQGQEALVSGSTNHISLYPYPADVRAGVQYGPNGMYVGTLTIGVGETIIRLRSITERF